MHYPLIYNSYNKKSGRKFSNDTQVLHLAKRSDSKISSYTNNNPKRQSAVIYKPKESPMKGTVRKLFKKEHHYRQNTKSTHSYKVPAVRCYKYKPDREALTPTVNERRITGNLTWAFKKL